MPQKSKLNLPPLSLGETSIGKRLAKFRKKRGFTQVQLANKIGIIQAMISDYETDRRGLSADMLSRFAIALNVSADEILGLRIYQDENTEQKLRLTKRINKIEKLPIKKQRNILNILDDLIQKAETNNFESVNKKEI